jgi:SHS2 domain-containing protein
MPWEYLEDAVTSDVAFRAWGRDLDELFTAAADATTNLMVGALETIAPALAIPVRVRAEALDLLLMRFLDELIFYKDARGLILRACDVRVTGDAAGGERGERAAAAGERAGAGGSGAGTAQAAPGGGVDAGAGFDRDGALEVSATLRGEPLDPAKHELAADVKAVTFHGLAVERTADGWRAQVTLDV